MADNNLVYSTETGRIKATKEKAQPQGQVYSDGFVRVERQTKGRKGKGVMLVKGVDPAEHDMKKLAKTLKSKMGQGGAVKEGVIEIQGDDRAKLKQLLEAQGFKVKIAGG